MSRVGWLLYAARVGIGSTSGYGQSVDGRAVYGKARARGWTAMMQTSSMDAAITRTIPESTFSPVNLAVFDTQLASCDATEQVGDAITADIFHVYGIE